MKMRRAASRIAIWICAITTMGILSFPAGTLGAEKITEEEGWDAHESHTRMHFQDNEMEFSLALILGATGNGGCEIGEAFVTAARIEEGNAESWQKEWIAMAELAEGPGEMRAWRRITP